MAFSSQKTRIRTKKRTPERLKFQLSLLDEIAYEGFPSNSFILISGEGGIAKSTILQCLANKFIESRFPCIYLCVDEHPLSVYQNMCLHGFKLKKYLKKGIFQFIDLFTYKLNLQNEEFDFLKNSLVVNYPINWQSLLNTVVSYVTLLESRYGKALVIIDSLTELLNKLDVNSVLDLMKALRFEICKKRNHPIFASSHFGIKTFEEFEQILEYHVDGIIDLRYDPVAMQYGSLVKQLRIRKLRASR
ncbi:MAG TPA: RAD55 family ATPase, partial [Geobacterales bacterium]|nr:RAD55 family ATPase [Geobacterales bacterium]